MPTQPHTPTRPLLALRRSACPAGSSSSTCWPKARSRRTMLSPSSHRRAWPPAHRTPRTPRGLSRGRGLRRAQRMARSAWRARARTAPHPSCRRTPLPARPPAAGGARGRVPARRRRRASRSQGGDPPPNPNPPPPPHAPPPLKASRPAPPPGGEHRLRRQGLPLDQVHRLRRRVHLDAAGGPHRPRGHAAVRRARGGHRLRRGQAHRGALRQGVRRARAGVRGSRGQGVRGAHPAQGVPPTGCDPTDHGPQPELLRLALPAAGATCGPSACCST